MIEPDRTDDNVTRRMCFKCWITRAANTFSEYVKLFHGNYGYANAHQYYVIRTLFFFLTLFVDTTV